MEKLDKKLQLAESALGYSVVRINPTAKLEAPQKNTDYSVFGVKNTDSIPTALIDKLRHSPDYLWLTVDKMADLGRSVDTKITNPLTYRHMTGSSSGACVNILGGITDFAIGTDGGGSVLAPALSTNLFSFMGNGAGLVSESTGVSTDGLGFSVGVGVIAKDFALLRQVSGFLCSTNFDGDSKELVRIIIPKWGDLILPDGTDARVYIDPMIKALPSNFSTEEHQFSDPYNRTATVTELGELTTKNSCDIVLS